MNFWTALCILVTIRMTSMCVGQRVQQKKLLVFADRARERQDARK